MNPASPQKPADHSGQVRNPRFKAIAAMSLNRVIGAGNRIPWHLPEDFKFFKKTTTGHVLVMGRKTFESIGKPLPNRETIVLSRSGATIPGVLVASALEDVNFDAPPYAGKQIFICGGAQIYTLALPLCSELFLTVVKREVDGDAFFPPFEQLFTLVETLIQTPEFNIVRYTTSAG